MISDDILQRSPSGVLTVCRSRNTLTIAAFVTGALAVVWYACVFAFPLRQPLQMVALLAPLPLLITALIRLISFLDENGELIYSFDPTTRAIRRNAKHIAQFSDIAGLVILPALNARTDNYRLSMLLRHATRPVQLATSGDLRQLELAADQIATLTRVRVEFDRPKLTGQKLATPGSAR